MVRAGGLEGSENGGIENDRNRRETTVPVFPFIGSAGITPTMFAIPRSEPGENVATVAGIGLASENGAIRNTTAGQTYPVGFIANPVQAHMANRAQQPKFTGIPGDYQTFCEDFEFFFESLGGTIATDDRQKLHVFKNCLDETNSKICAARMLTDSTGFTYRIFRKELDQKYSLRMTDREARKIWESVSLKFENRLTVTPWEAFCVKFNDERRHVKNLASWEGRELLLAQLPNDIRCKLITEEENAVGSA